MESYDYDLLVIGAGSGGVRCARMSASFGAKVAIIEGQYWGGTCVNVGCVPKKLYSYAAHYHEDFSDARGFGWVVDKPSFNWPTLRDNKTAEIQRLNGIYINMLSNAGVELYHGYATMTSKHEVNIVDSDGKQQTVTAKNILLATGGKPVLPEIEGIDKSLVSDEIFDLPSFPKVITVLGSGYIAVEFASIFNGLGAEVHLICRGDRVLRGFDNEIAYELTAQLQQKGIHIHSETLLSKVEGETGDLSLTLADGSTIACNQLMTAVGRSPNLDFAGSLAGQIKTDAKGYVVVNEQYQTSIDNLYAVGDLIGGMELTPVALAEGMAVAYDLYADQAKPVDYNDIATAVFSHPNLGTVGLTEEQARDQYDNIEVFKSKFRHLKHTLSGNDEKTMMKIIVDAETDKVLGLHILGSDAGEIVQGFAVALKAGATKAVFDATIGIHPTAAEELVTMRSPS
jgi:glutathione reductase (NADPH)